VHGFPSSQSAAVWHAPAATHCQLTHCMPAGHAPQLPPHPSSPHALPAQLGVQSTHCPPWHTWPAPHGGSQQFGIGWCTHPANGSHQSIVHGFPSSQLFGCALQSPSMHTPGSMHAPPVEQTWPSAAGVHLHVPSVPHSATRHAFPSSHSDASVHGHPSNVRCTHCPVAGLQPSLVHSFPSSQRFGVPTHAPTWQWSPTVHRLPSSHGPPSGPASAMHCPTVTAHFITWHGEGAGPQSASPAHGIPTHTPAWHVCPAGHGGLQQPAISW